MLYNILTQLGTTAVIMAIAGFLFKTWISHHLQKTINKSEHQLAMTLEAVRAEWAKDIAKLNVHEEYLHKKRVDLIEDLYSKMIEAEFFLQNFLLSWWAESNKEKITEKLDGEEIEFSMARGIEFCEKYTEINAILHRNALYFDDAFIQKIKDTYDPVYKLIISFGENDFPDFPEKFRDIITAGQEPRRLVIELFREALGVQNLV